MLQSDVIEYSSDDKINHVVDGFGMVVEARGSRDDDGAPLGQLVHVFQMDGRVWCFTWNKDELPAFLESNDGGPCDEVVTNGGVVRKITSVEESFAALEIAVGVIEKVQKQGINQKMPKGSAKL